MHGPSKKCRLFVQLQCRGQCFFGCQKKGKLILNSTNASVTNDISDCKTGAWGQRKSRVRCTLNVARDTDDKIHRSLISTSRSVDNVRINYTRKEGESRVRYYYVARTGWNLRLGLCDGSELSGWVKLKVPSVLCTISMST